MAFTARVCAGWRFWLLASSFISVEAFLTAIASNYKINIKSIPSKPERLTTLKNKEDSSTDDDSIAFSRREIIVLGTGGLAYAKVVADALNKLRRGDAYPIEHERRVSNIFEKAIVEAATSMNKSEDSSRPLRVLEIGIGTNCRTICRGMYDKALVSFDQLRHCSDGISFYGVDIETPSVDIINKARRRIVAPLVSDQDSQNDLSYPVSFEVSEGDISNGISSFSDGFFDVITCSLVLCSVEDQTAALGEIKRLLNPRTGSFGYVEHVAVDLDNEPDYSFLEWEQRFFDPLQQIVAHNCHLHRTTDRQISYTFPKDQGWQSSSFERFFVEDMFPITCQCCGVIKRI